jgi:hypothetical protein
MVIVNGYICMNCCDIDEARLGQDSQQTTDQVQKQLKRHIDRLDPANFGPAVAFGGSLQGPCRERGRRQRREYGRCVANCTKPHNGDLVPDSRLDRLAS